MFFPVVNRNIVFSATQRIFYQKQHSGQYRRLFSFWANNVNKNMRTTRDGQTGMVTISPPVGKHSATIVLMHGLGDTSAGWESTADMLSTQCPHVKFIVPTAPTRPITLNGGMSMPGWYDIKSLGVGNEDLSPTRVLDTCEGIEESRAAIEAILEAEHRATGLPYSRMMLGGFSQGGALSLYTGLQIELEKKLAGLVVMSGYLPNHTNLQVTTGMGDLPILHCHGKQDPLVRYHYAEHGRKYLVEQQNFESYTLQGFNNLEHGVNNDVIRQVLTFIQQSLPPGVEHVPPPKEFINMSVKELKTAVAQANLSKHCVGFSEKSDFVNLLTNHYQGPHAK